MDRLDRLLDALAREGVRFVMIGAAGANYYAEGGSTLFTTKDRDLILPPDPDNLVSCWRACEVAGLSLWSGNEPRATPRDRALAQRIVERPSGAPEKGLTALSAHSAAGMVRLAAG